MYASRGCLSYVISHGGMISMVNIMPLSVDVHPHPHIRIVFIGLHTPESDMA